MSRVSRAGRRSVVVPIALLAALTVAFASSAGDAAATKAVKKPRVTLRVVTKDQRQLLKHGRLTVKVAASGKVRVSLRAAGFRTRSVRFGRKGSRRIALRWTPQGRKRLSGCGGFRVKVKGSYRARVLRGGRWKKRSLTAKAKRFLRRDASRCAAPKRPVEPVPHVDTGNAERCDFLAGPPTDSGSGCLAPWPNDYFTVPDPGTDTGRRLAVHPRSTPANANGMRTDPAELNRSDGFSPAR